MSEHVTCGAGGREAVGKGKGYNHACTVNAVSSQNRAYDAMFVGLIGHCQQLPLVPWTIPAWLNIFNIKVDEHWRSLSDTDSFWTISSPDRRFTPGIPLTDLHSQTLKLNVTFKNFKQAMHCRLAACMATVAYKCFMFRCLVGNKR